MAAINEVITLGIGTPADIKSFITVGFDIGTSPPPSPGSGVGGAGVSSDVYSGVSYSSVGGSTVEGST